MHPLNPYSESTDEIKIREGKFYKGYVLAHERVGPRVQDLGMQSSCSHQKYVS